MSKLDDLIFDRTIEDIEQLTNKAFISNEDLNRIENAIKYIAYMLNDKGFRCVVNNKLNWKMMDKRSELEMERIRSNLEIIRTTFFAPNGTPNIPAAITYTSIYQANAIEQIIHDIGRLIESAYPAHQRLGFRLGTKAFGGREI